MLVRSLLAATAGILALLFISVWIPAQPQATTGPTLSVDTDISGNGSYTVGTIEPCRSVSASSDFDVDIVIQNVTSLAGFQADLYYNDSLLTLTRSRSAFIMSGGFLLDLSDETPDTNLDGKYHILLTTTANASGSGVIMRFTFHAGAAAGTSMLDLGNVKMKDYNNVTVQPADSQGFYTGPVNDGWIVVGGECGAAPTPTPCPDSDGDGWTNCQETYIGTDPSNACTPAGWPPDPAPAPDGDGVDQIEDVTFAAARFGARTGDEKYTPRAEIASQDGMVHIDDITAFASRFGIRCTGG